MTWSTSTAELKVLLSDGDTDKVAWKKRCVGLVNGTNVRFKTFEARRVTDFTSVSLPVSNGVFVDGTKVTVSSDEMLMGEFVLATPPNDGSVVEASYYYRWFTDAEIAQFMTNAMQWIGRGDDVTQLESGLHPAALEYGASKAYQKLAVRWAEQISQTFKLEDQPDPKAKEVQNPYAQMARDYLKSAMTLRKDFYARNDQALAPLFGAVRGRVRDVVPKS